MIPRLCLALLRGGRNASLGDSVEMTNLCERYEVTNQHGNQLEQTYGTVAGRDSGGAAACGGERQSRDSAAAPDGGVAGRPRRHRVACAGEDWCACAAASFR